METHTDYIVVGQGLAGTILALTLLEQGQRVCLLAHRSRESASEVAAGLFNPITGKRMSKTWQVDQLFPFLRTYYRKTEQQLGASFLYELPIYRPFVSVEEQNTWIAETSRPEIAPFAQVSDEDTRLSQYVANPYGGMCIRQAGYLDTVTFLAAARQYLQHRGVYQERLVDYAQVRCTPDKVTYQDIQAHRLIFCDGPYATDNPFFGWLPFRPVKGEVILAEIDDFQAEYIINQHLFVIPLPDQTYRIGATYYWKTLDWQPTEAGRNELLEKAERLIQRPVRVLQHRAGIRPATADRRPLMGLHPEMPSIGFFGGMGSKGVSLVPYLAQHFADHLLAQKEILPEANIQRYVALYTSMAHGTL